MITYNIDMQAEFQKLKESQYMNPDRLREAIRTLEEALMPAALQAKEYQDRITALDNENYRLRGALDVASRTISEVQAVVGPRARAPFERAPTLAEHVRERLNSEQSAYSSATHKLRERIRTHENAESRLRQEVASMLKLYNEAAGYILFSEEQAKQADYALLLYDHIAKSLQVLREQAATTERTAQEVQDSAPVKPERDPDDIHEGLRAQGLELAYSTSPGNCAGCVFEACRPWDQCVSTRIAMCIREHACTNDGAGRKGGIWVRKEVNNP